MHSHHLLHNYLFLDRFPLSLHSIQMKYNKIEKWHGREWQCRKKCVQKRKSTWRVLEWDGKGVESRAHIKWKLSSASCWGRWGGLLFVFVFVLDRVNRIRTDRGMSTKLNIHRYRVYEILNSFLFTKTTE